MDTSFQTLAAIMGIGLGTVILISSKSNPKISREDRIWNFLMGVLCLGLFGYICLNAGHGYVPGMTESLSQRLSNGHVYWTTGTAPDGRDVILTIMDEKKNSDGTHSFISIRIQRSLPPMHFAMIDGKPVAIAP
ncbi:MAG: hypothetical protein ACYCZZ_00800 [Minisyncoccota bacterium]